MSDNTEPKFWAIVPAAGAGKRMGTDIPKQYLPLGDKTVLEHTLDTLLSCQRLAGVILVLSPGDERWAEMQHRYTRQPLETVPGGVERCHSVLNGLDYLATRASDEDWALVHDAARPCIRLEDIEQLITTLERSAEGGLLGVPVADTMKRVDEDVCISGTVDRNGLWHAFTPQMFRVGMLRAALQLAIDKGQQVTDEASAMELAGYRPRLVQGSRDNIKITVPSDLALAAFYLQSRRVPVRIGQGFDVHAFQDGGILVLGGVTVPHDRSLEAHSDGDVVLHALCDALLGAVGLGDIGRHFPPDDEAWKNIDSRVLLRKTCEQVANNNYKVVNADITVVAQAPKLAPYIDVMCQNISEDLQVDVAQVNVKATTTEHLGFTGRGEGIAAFAVVLLETH